MGSAPSVSVTPVAGAQSVRGVVTGGPARLAGLSGGSASGGGAAGISVALAVSPRSPVTGQRVRLIATLTPVPPDGTVAFRAGTTTIRGCGAVPIAATGQAVCATRFARPGHARLRAVYSGGATFGRARSPVRMVAIRWSVNAAGPPRLSGAAVVTRLSCARVSGGCPVVIALTVGGAAGRTTSGIAGRGPLIGSATATLPPGATEAVSVPLNRSGQALVAGRTQVTATETIALRRAGRLVIVARLPVAIG